MSKTILIIDDDPIMCLVASEALKPFACRVLQAADGASGLAAAEHAQPDLILLDYSMPGMAGTAVLSLIRSNSKLARTPVMMLTSESERSIVLKAALLGICGYLIKPVKIETLIQKINQVLNLPHKEAESGADTPAGRQL